MGAAELGLIGFLLLILFGVKKTNNKNKTSDSKTSLKSNDADGEGKVDSNSSFQQSNRKPANSPKKRAPVRNS